MTTAAAPLDLALARTLADTAVAYAEQIGLRVSVAVVDEFGEDVVVLSMDGAPRFTPSFARAKARSVVAMKGDSADIAALKARYPDEVLDQLSDAAGFRITSLLGGRVLLAEGRAIGGIGASGATPEQDDACAGASYDLWAGQRA